MPQARPRSVGVTAAATYAILCCMTAFLFWSYILLTVINAPPDELGTHLYEKFPVQFLCLALLPPALIALGIRTAIGLFQLRPWARVGAMVWASLSLTLCLALIAFRPFETFFIPRHFVRETELYKQLVAISFVLMLFPVSVWWLFYFRAKGVKMQFQTPDSKG